MLTTVLSSEHSRVHRPRGRVERDLHLLWLMSGKTPPVSVPLPLPQRRFKGPEVLHMRFHTVIFTRKYKLFAGI